MAWLSIGGMFGRSYGPAVMVSSCPHAPTATVNVAIDSSKHELTITAGPYDLPNMPPMDGHAMMDLGMSHDTPVQHFEWPIDGWFRGFRVDLVDAKGQPVPRHVMHHLIMVNFSRRQLLYSAAERLMGAGTETDDEVSVPKTIGVPMSPGMKLGMYVAWHNDTGKDLDGVYLKLTMLLDAQEPESAAGQLPADLHGREPDRRREQHLRRAAGQILQGLRVHASHRRAAARRRRPHA